MKRLLGTLVLALVVASLAAGIVGAAGLGSATGADQGQVRGDGAANRPGGLAPRPVTESDGLTVAIEVAPKLLVLSANNTWVTVHADIPFSQVADSTVALNGIPAAQVFADDCGDLVAKFTVEAVKAIVAPPEALLTLTGTTTDGVAFEGSAVIRVFAGRPG